MCREEDYIGEGEIKGDPKEQRAPESEVQQEDGSDEENESKVTDDLSTSNMGNNLNSQAPDIPDDTYYDVENIIR